MPFPCSPSPSSPSSPPPTSSTAAGSRGSSSSTTRATTPAVKVNDGVDFVPTRPFYLFAQHFSAIAAAGPIAGPILACQAFGWLPCLLWIALGVVLIGAVHDFSSLTASVRHGAQLDRRDHARAPRAARRPRDDGVHLDRARLRHRRVHRHHRGELRRRHRGAAAGAARAFNPGGAVAAASVMYLGARGRARASCSASSSRRSGW